MTILFLRSRSFAALAIGLGSAAAFAQTTSTIPAVSPDDRYSLGLVGLNLTNNYYLLYAPGVAGGTSVPLAIGEQRGSWRVAAKWRCRPPSNFRTIG